MKRFCYIGVVMLLLSPTFVRAQHHSNHAEATDMADQFVTNYDSLLNSYVLNKYAASTRRHRANINADYAFDQIPDSVIAKRLHSLHTIIPMTFNSEVRSYIRMYLNRMRGRLDVMLTLSEFYYPIFEEALSRYDVPEELKHLTIVESAMNPQATSRVGAAGLWQFMYTTGKNYGLEVNSIIDERRDTYKSSDAAAHYIHDLYNVFGDWHLAIAAYNCGPGNINKAIARSGGKRDFWQIYPYLPRETRGYIPAFIAAMTASTSVSAFAGISIKSFPACNALTHAEPLRYFFAPSMVSASVKISPSKPNLPFSKSLTHLLLIVVGTRSLSIAGTNKCAVSIPESPASR